MFAAKGWAEVITEFDPFPEALIGLVPNLAATLVVTLTVGAWVAPRLNITRWASILWLGSLLIPIAYTWTRSWGYDAGPCTAGIWPWDDAGSAVYYEMVTNILLTVPAGAAAWLWPAGERRWSALVCALATPMVIETVQRWAPQLQGRTCQVSDVAFNLAGVAVGFAVVAIVVALRGKSNEKGPVSLQ